MWKMEFTFKKYDVSDWFTSLVISFKVNFVGRSTTNNGFSNNKNVSSSSYHYVNY